MSPHRGAERVHLQLLFAIGAGIGVGGTPSQHDMRMVFPLRALPRGMSFRGPRPVPDVGTSSFEGHQLEQHTTQQQRRLGLSHHEAAIVEIENANDLMYVVEVEVGTTCDGAPLSSLYLVLDTGSSNVWIQSVDCKKCPHRFGSFNINNSCSARDLGGKQEFKYGDGTKASGTTFVDQIKLGTLVVNKSVVTRVDELAGVIQSAGILGLAMHANLLHASTSSDVGEAFITTVLREHQQMGRRFSLSLNDRIEDSWLIYGDPHMERFSKEKAFHYSSSAWVEVVNQWIISLWSIGWSGLGEMRFDEFGQVGQGALVDSGTSLIVLAPNIFDFMVSAIQTHLSCDVQSGLAVCKCPSHEEMGRLPMLVLNMVDSDNQQYPLCMSPDEYMVRFGMFSCSLGLQRGSDNQTVPIILGMAFFRSYYTTFDVARKRVGFARSTFSRQAAGTHCWATSVTWAHRATWMAAMLITFVAVVFPVWVVIAPINGVNGSTGSSRGGPAASSSSSSVNPAPA
eukprot:TRINITY_DN62548_c0_g1_i1.p1 TRINITY_DN62548_c0_g1~~TRINITY_DN62548_c0_g1_i1.p1  ORF type:complete len:510 (+),score=71.76 TRINITY_DN62548_c0_g1_i1:208-1737(+)